MVHGQPAFSANPTIRSGYASPGASAAIKAISNEPLGKSVIFATSGLGGILGWMVIHPVNTVAVRMNISGSQKSFSAFAGGLVKTEGVGTLYQGLSAGMLRQVPYATTRFGLFETMRDVMAKYRKTDFAQRFFIASVSGGVAALVSCPVEVCLVRMSNDNALPVAERRGYTGVFNAISRIAAEEGIPAFWRGSQPFVMRAMLVGGTQVATYDQFKQLYASLGVNSGLGNTFCSAMSAGLIYSIITAPFETAKNKMASQKPDPKTGKLPFTGTMQTVTKIASMDGALALWSGFLPYYMRCGGHTVSMFIFVEQLRKFYRSM